MKKLVIVCVSLFFFGCVSYKYYPYSYDKHSASNIRTVVFVPSSQLFRMPDDMRTLSTTVYDGVRTYLAGHGITVKEAGPVTPIWQEEQRKVGGLYNSSNGSFREEAYVTCLKAMVKRVCRDQGVDAVVFAELAMRPATLDGTVVYWDGALENIETEYGYANPSTGDFSGETTALSIKILIVDRNGQMVLRNYAGLVHPYRAVMDRKRHKWEKRPGLSVDPKKLDRAVALSLHPFIPYSEFPENPAFLKN